MRTVKTKVYLFTELSEEAKETAIQNYSDINLYDDWYESIYEDAKTIGLKIISFDLDRNRHAKGELYNSATETADLIKSNHGEMCGTYKTAINFLDSYNSLVENYSDGVKLDVVHEGNEYEFDRDADELEKEFLNDLLEDYSIILEKEYEYLQSDVVIIEGIISNGYEFTKEGETPIF